MYKCLQENQPINITGAVRHVGLWLTSSTENIIYKNPHYIPGEQPSRDIAIYCVHGTADRNNAFSLLVNNILKKLPNTISSIHLLSFDERYQGIGIEDFAHQLKETVEKNAHTNIICMGHSRGGLVIAYFTEFLADTIDVKVHSCLPIAAPFSGTDMAILPIACLSTSVDQMRPHSDFLQHLKEKMKLHVGLYEFFAAEKDLVVPLSSTFVPEQSQYLTVYDRHGHLSMMSSHRLAADILKRLWGIATELSLNTVCQDIENYLQNFKKKNHLSDSTGKLHILQKLQILLQSGNHAGVKTIGALIDQFWNDKKQGNGRTPKEILNDSLNGPLSFFQPYNASSYNFMYGLILRYTNIPLISHLTEVEDTSLLKKSL